MRASVKDYLFELLDQRMMNSLIYFYCKFDETLNIDIFQKSFFDEIQQSQGVLCNLTGGYNIKNWTRADINRDEIFLCSEFDDEISETTLLHDFFLSENNYINIHEDFPIKVICFHLKKECRWISILCGHHAISDSSGYRFFLSNVGARYERYVAMEDKPIIQLRRLEKGDWFNLRSDYLQQFKWHKSITEDYITKKKEIKPIVEKQQLIKGKNANIAVATYTVDLKTIKNAFADYSFTVNDILVYLALRVNSVIDNGKNIFLSTEYRMDLRPYAKDEARGLMGNYSFENPITLNTKDVIDKKSFKIAIDSSKKTLAGFGELTMYQILDMIVTGVSTRVIRFGSLGKKKDKSKGMGVTNMGKYDEVYVSFRNCLLECFSFSGGFYTGAPLLHVSSYKEKLCFCLVGYRDKQNTFQKFNVQLKKVIQKYAEIIEERCYE